jgi:hypothetical protein
MITNPINYLNGPKKVCEASTNENVKSDLTNIIRLITRGDYKEAHKKMQFLKELANSNAMVNFVYANTLKNLSKFDQAKKYYKLSNAFDCHKKTPSTVYNTITKEVALDNQVYIYDFDSFLLHKSMTNIAFIDSTYPQPLYFSELAETIGLKLRKLLGL